MENLRILLARAHGVCISNSERVDTIDVAKTSTSGLYHELKLDLPGFMEDFISADTVLKRCREIFTGSVSDCQHETLYSLLHEIYSSRVAEDCREDFRTKHCLGCQFVDGCGIRGHPSQRRHECLMMDPVERLDICFPECFKKVKKAIVIGEFLDSLNPELLRPSDNEFYESIITQMESLHIRDPEPKRDKIEIPRRHP